MTTATTERDAALWVIRTLREAGYQALLAGGCVRDMLLNETSSDYDVATDAHPRDVQKIFRRVLLVGEQFGVAVVLKDTHQIEVATFRSDLDYADGRRPEGVVYSTPQADAARRDFTINGMFYDPLDEEVIDYVGGRDDLQRGVIRTIGQPDERFGEDYLRLIRAVRFAARLGFRIEPATANAIRRHADSIARISGERVFDELWKMLSHHSAIEALHMLLEYRLLPHILPELFEPNDEVWLHAWQRLARLPVADDAMLNLAAMLMDLDGATQTRIVRRWGASNHLRSDLHWLGEHRDDYRRDEMPLCELKRLMAHQAWPYLKLLWGVREKIEHGSHERVNHLIRRADAIRPEQIAPEPLVTGTDLKQLGLAESPALGQILKTLYDAQLNETLTRRQDALAEARRLAGE